MRTQKALARLRGCAVSPEPSLVAYVISTIISLAGSFCYRKSSVCHGRPYTFTNRVGQSSSNFKCSASPEWDEGNFGADWIRLVFREMSKDRHEFRTSRIGLFASGSYSLCASPNKSHAPPPRRLTPSPSFCIVHRQQNNYQGVWSSSERSHRSVRLGINGEYKIVWDLLQKKKCCNFYCISDRMKIFHSCSPACDVTPVSVVSEKMTVKMGMPVIDCGDAGI